MTETLLDIVNTALGELMLPTNYTSVVANTDDFAVGMLAMANAAGRDLVRRAEWGALITLATFPTVAGQSDYPLPSDFYRMVDDAMWDQSTNWPVPGPLTPQAEQYLRDSSYAASNIYRQYRQVGKTTLRFFPTPPDASGLIAYEYLSRNWVVHVGGVTGAGLTADTDTTVFHFDLMVKSCKWRWMAAKGQDAAEFKSEYDDALAAYMSADQGGGVLNMGPCDVDQGGNVFAGTSPNFRLSTGSGNYIVAS